MVALDLEALDYLPRKGSDSTRTSATSIASVDVDLWSLDMEDLLKNMPDEPTEPPLLRSRSLSLHETPRRRSSLKKGGVNRRPILASSVSFDKVQVREFQQVLSDNPPKDNGPSIGLGWNYTEKKDIQVNKFESKRNSSLFRRRRNTVDALFLSSSRRERIAKDLGYTNEEIQKNVRQVERCRIRRKKSVEEATKLGRDTDEGFDPISFMKAAKRMHGLAA
jgi:hypothetical protein